MGRAWMRWSSRQACVGTCHATCVGTCHATIRHVASRNKPPTPRQHGSHPLPCRPHHRPNTVRHPAPTVRQADAPPAHNLRLPPPSPALRRPLPRRRLHHRLQRPPHAQRAQPRPSPSPSLSASPCRPRGLPRSSSCGMSSRGVRGRGGRWSGGHGAGAGGGGGDGGHVCQCHGSVRQGEGQLWEVGAPGDGGGGAGRGVRGAPLQAPAAPGEQGGGWGKQLVK